MDFRQHVDILTNGNSDAKYYLQALVAPYCYVQNYTQSTFTRHSTLCIDTLYRSTLSPLSTNDINVEDITLQEQCAHQMSDTLLTAWFPYSYTQIL